MSGLGRALRAVLVAFVLASSSNPSFSATITAEMDKFIGEDAVVRIEGPILPGDAERLATLVLPLRREDALTRLWLYVTINSEGGSVSEALKIGRFLRHHKASVQFREGDQCLSSCVFLLMAGVVRVTDFVDVVVGVHRPFLFAADQNQDFERIYRETRSGLEAYFDEMRVSRSLLDLIYSVPPGRTRTLSRDELDLFLPFMDPVYEEQEVTDLAQIYGISNFEYRSREKRVEEECAEIDSFEEQVHCRGMILWGLTLEEYLVRNALSDKICLEGILDRSALRVPPELNARDCRVYIMRHGV